jgi:hypothetical protein
MPGMQKADIQNGRYDEVNENGGHVADWTALQITQTIGN